MPRSKPTPISVLCEYLNGEPNLSDDKIKMMLTLAKPDKLPKCLAKLGSLSKVGFCNSDSNFLKSDRLAEFPKFGIGTGI